MAAALKQTYSLSAAAKLVGLHRHTLRKLMLEEGAPEPVTQEGNLILFSADQIPQLVALAERVKATAKPGYPAGRARKAKEET